MPQDMHAKRVLKELNSGSPFADFEDPVEIAAWRGFGI